MDGSEEELQERIKNMSPEELKEFQKKQCIFCQIISGKVQSRKLYSDSECTAVLDINPANPGHILLLPNEHYPILPLIPDEIVGKLFLIARGLSNACLKALKSEGTTIFVANGLVAGQKAQHFMIHIIPRMPNDGIEFSLPQKQMTPQDMQTVQKIVKKRLNELLGIQSPFPEKLEGPKKASWKIAEPKVEPTEGTAEKTSQTKAEMDLDSISRLLK